MTSDGLQAEIERFLYQEADLLDSWQLAKWLELFSDDAVYLIPSADLPADASPDTSLFYVADDRFRLGERVARLLKKTGHSEYPHSKTRHMISNVQFDSPSNDTLHVSANFLCIRTKDAHTDQFWGKSHYELIRGAEGFKIHSKRCVLDIDGLISQGRITIIL